MDICKTKEGLKYRYNNNHYHCPSKNTYYCVLKNDSIEKPNRQDTCINCGQTFRKHHHQKTHEEERWYDAIRDAFLETPAE